MLLPNMRTERKIENERRDKDVVKELSLYTCLHWKSEKEIAIIVKEGVTNKTIKNKTKKVYDHVYIFYIHKLEEQLLLFSLTKIFQASNSADIVRRARPFRKWAGVGCGNRRKSF